MAGLNLGGITINAQEVLKYKDVIQATVINDLTLRQLHQVDEGIKNKENLLFSSKMGRVGQLSTNDCEIPISTGSIDFSQKEWDLATIEETLVLCGKSLNKSFKPNNDDINKWIDRYDFRGSEQMAFIILHLTQAMVEMIWRAVWFGNTAVAVADAGTAGLIVATAAVNVKYYNYFDGIWEQIFDGVTATDITRVTIAENAITTSIDDQLTLADGACNGYLVTMRQKAPVALRSNTNAIFYVSGEMFMNQEYYLIKNSIAWTNDLVENGVQTMKFRGYTLVNMETIWNSDEKGAGTRVDFTNNTTTNVYDKPHRLVYADPANLRVGTLSENDFTEFDVQLVKKKIEIDFGLELESKVVKESEIVVAY